MLKVVSLETQSHSKFHTYESVCVRLILFLAHKSKSCAFFAPIVGTYIAWKIDNDICGSTWYFFVNSSDQLLFFWLRLFFRFFTKGIPSLTWQFFTAASDNLKRRKKSKKSYLEQQTIIFWNHLGQLIVSSNSKLKLQANTNQKAKTCFGVFLVPVFVIQLNSKTTWSKVTLKKSRKLIWKSSDKKC